MENLELIMSLAGTACSLLVACVIFIIKIVHAVKSKKNIVNLNLLEEAIIPLMEIAEKYQHYSGEEKKEYVLTKLNQFAIENGLKYDAEAISEKVEKLIELSKQVNAK